MINKALVGEIIGFQQADGLVPCPTLRSRWLRSLIRTACGARFVSVDDQRGSRAHDGEALSALSREFSGQAGPFGPSEPLQLDRCRASSYFSDRQPAPGVLAPKRR